VKYRSDIDGLRTIAVLLVILNHAGFTSISGGFVGVDVFFVISGFLITAIIAPKIANNTFSIGWFLSRRIKRLMPVLFFIIIASALLFTFVMLPQDLTKFYRSIIWVVLYGANFFFWREHGGYFDGNSEEVPLLHTWSLAVEEQYYLVWPIMLIAMIRFLGPKRTIIASLLLCIAATIFSQWGTEITIGAAYYLLPTRFFELLVGSCLALLWPYLPKLKLNIQHSLSIVGLALIIFSAFYLSKHHAFPGYNALYPVLGTALIIIAQHGVVNRFLSTRAMVYTGNISYSLYLWHWPLLAFIRYTSIELTLFVQIFVIILTYLLSMFSYRFIEQPFRDMKLNNFKVVAIKLYLAPSVFIIALATIGIYQKGYEQRFTPEIIKQEIALNSFASESRKNCHSALRDSTRLPSNDCIFSPSGTPSGSVFIIGDSHANHIIPLLKVLTNSAQLSGQDYTLDRCLPIIELPWGSNLYKANKCKERNKIAYEHIKKQRFNYVVLSASWPEIATKRIFTDSRILDNKIKKQLLEKQFQLSIETIISTGAIPIIVEDIPTLGGVSPKCPLKKELFNKDLACNTKHNTNKLIGELVTSALHKYPEIITIKPQKLLCTDNNCRMMLNNTPLYRDEDHLNEIGAEMMGKEYLAKYGNPFQPPSVAQAINGQK
jgi:peptidoglycan/LPS O-acetylase OafA/YrhL